MELNLDTLDVPVEDLIRIDVSYGKLTLLVKAILDKLKQQGQDLKQQGEEMRQTKAQQSQMANMQDYLVDQVQKLEDETGVEKSAPPERATPTPPAQVAAGLSQEELDGIDRKIKAVKDDLDALKEQVARMGGSKSPDGGAQDVIMVNHEERIKQLEGELDTLHMEDGLVAAHDMMAVEGAISTAWVAPACNLKAGEVSEKHRFTLNSAVEGGAVELTPSAEGITFSPSTLKVPKGTAESEEFTATVKDKVSPGAIYIDLKIVGKDGNKNALPANNLVATGITIRPSSVKQPIARSGSMKSRTGSGASTPTKAGSKPGSRKSSTEANSRKSSGASAADSRKGSAADRKTSGPLKALYQTKPISKVGIDGSPVSLKTQEVVTFNVDAPCAGGDLVLVPEAAGLIFDPAQVTIAPGDVTSGSCKITATKAAPSGSVPMIVGIIPSKANTNTLDAESFEVEDLSVDSTPEEREAADATREQVGKDAMTGKIGSVQLQSGMTISQGGAASSYTSLTINTEAKGGSVLLTPQAEGITCTPAKIVVPAGSTHSQPFVMKAMASSPQGPVTLKVTAEGLEGCQNEFADSYEVVGLAVNAKPSSVASPLSPMSPALSPHAMMGKMSSMQAPLYDRLAEHEKRLIGIEASMRVGTPRTSARVGDPDLAMRVKVLEDLLRKLDDGKGDASPELAGGVEDLQRRLERLEKHITNRQAATTPNPLPPSGDTLSSLDKSSVDGLHASIERLSQSELNSTAELEDMAKKLKIAMADLQRINDKLGEDSVSVDGKLKALDKKCTELEQKTEENKAQQFEANKDFDDRLKADADTIGVMNTKINTLASKSASGGTGGVDPSVVDALRAEYEATKGLVAEIDEKVTAYATSKASKQDHDRLSTDVSALDDRLKMLGMKVEMAQDSGIAPVSDGSGAISSSPLAIEGLDGADVLTELREVRVMVSTHGGMIDNLFRDKASRDVMVRLSNNVDDLRALFEARPKFTSSGGKSSVDPEALASIQTFLSQLDVKIKKLDESKAGQDYVQKLIEALKETIATQELTKADSVIVAGKAERDYVEKALEKLRREVEQVMNNTNSGLIDTLDKSLNILRDMIDGKANAADMMKLREVIMSESKKDDTPEGLAGYKHYRCLSCNRQMDGMRPRPMGMNFMNFMSHLPNPRNKQYSNNKISTQTSVAMLPPSMKTTGPKDGDVNLPPLAAPECNHGSPPGSAPAASGVQSLNL